MEKNTPAFPTPRFMVDKDARFNGFSVNTDGMTLRDYFAAKALPVCYRYWMNDFYHPDYEDAEDRNAEGRDDLDSNMKELIAEYAYALADAMLKARQA